MRPAAMTSLYSKNFEKLHLFAPIPIFLLGSLGYLLAPEPGSTLRPWIQLSVAIVFFNTVHVGFTFALLLSLREFRQWIKQRSNGHTLRQWLKWLLVFSGLYYFADYSQRNLLVDAKVFFIFFAAVAAHHSLSQMMGISLLYNKLALQSDSTNDRQETIAQATLTEKKLFSIFIAFNMLIYLLRAYDYEMPVLVALLVNGFLCYKIYRIASPHKKLFSSNKKIYLLRIFIVLFYFINLFWTQLIIAAIHGVEYIMLSIKMIWRSTERKFIALAIGVLIAALLIVVDLYTLLPSTGLLHVTEGQMIDLVALSTALTAIHYYLDGLMFRFSKSPAAQEIQKLLLR